jgi:hypothetical protein
MKVTFEGDVAALKATFEGDVECHFGGLGLLP